MLSAFQFQDAQIDLVAAEVDCDNLHHQALANPQHHTGLLTNECVRAWFTLETLI